MSGNSCSSSLGPTWGRTCCLVCCGPLHSEEQNLIRAGARPYHALLREPQGLLNLSEDLPRRGAGPAPQALVQAGAGPAPCFQAHVTSRTCPSVEQVLLHSTWPELGQNVLLAMTFPSAEQVLLPSAWPDLRQNVLHVMEDSDYVVF